MARKKSNFVRPMGDLEWNDGRTPQEDEEDDRRSERIPSFVPDAEILGPLVVACLEGYRKQFKIHLEKNEEGRTWFEKLKKRFGHLFRNVDNADKDKFNELIEEAEVSYVRQEIARYWIDALLTAWDILSEAFGGPPDNLILDDSFLPDAEKCHGVSTKWEERLRKLEQSLRNAIALNDNDFNSVMRQFRENVRKALEKGQVELPDGIDLVLGENNQPRLKARRFAP